MGEEKETRNEADERQQIGVLVSKSEIEAAREATGIPMKTTAVAAVFRRGLKAIAAEEAGK